MQVNAEFAGTTKQFCYERKISVQISYSRRHAMCLASAMRAKKGALQKQISTKMSLQADQFVKAQVTSMPSSGVLQTHHAQLSLSTQCHPVWLATLLKGLDAL
jgi:hypothetical protein